MFSRGINSQAAAAIAAENGSTYDPKGAHSTNAWVRGGIGYSYAQPVVNPLPNAVIVTAKHWSQSTTSHVTGFLRAINLRGRPILYLPEVLTPSHWSNYKWHIAVAKEQVEKLTSPRVRFASRVKAIHDGANAIWHFDKLCELFGVPEDMEVSLSMAEARHALEHSPAAVKTYAEMALKGDGYAV